MVSRQACDVDLVLVARRPVLVLVGALADGGLHRVQHGGVQLGAAEGGVARHFGIELVDAVRQQEAAAVEGALRAVLRGVGAGGEGVLLDDAYKFFHTNLKFDGLSVALLPRLLNAKLRKGLHGLIFRRQDIFLLSNKSNRLAVSCPASPSHCPTTNKKIPLPSELRRPLQGNGNLFCRR